MNDDHNQLDRYLSHYEDLAIEVLDDPRSNIKYGLPWSNEELTQIVLEDMDWESFDLFQNMPYAAAYGGENEDQARALSFVAFLRMMLFSAAFVNNVGEPEFNKTVAAHSEYWFRMLRDRYESLSKKNETKHRWIN